MNQFLQLPIILLVSAVVAESVTVTQEEFNSATTKNGFRTPPLEYYNYFVEGASKYSKEEQAMLLAQLLHESQGFYYTEEQLCVVKGNKCADSYKNKDLDLPGKTYWGRGFIQLTGAANYKAASQALGLGDKLLREPEVVASDKKLAMLVSIWFWDANVHPRLRVKENQFGVTTFAINSGECRYPKYHPRAQKRWVIYLKVAEALGITNKAKETGCYN